MIPIFMLFMMVCDSSGHNCKPANGGYYVSQAACQRAFAERREQMTDGQCVRRWGWPH